MTCVCPDECPLTLYDPGARVRYTGDGGGINGGLEPGATGEVLCFEAEAGLYEVRLDEKFHSCTEDDGVWLIGEEDLDPLTDEP